MSDCLRRFLVLEVPFYILILLLARFGGGLAGREIAVLGAVCLLCLAFEYPMFKRRWNDDR